MAISVFEKINLEKMNWANQGTVKTLKKDLEKKLQEQEKVYGYIGMEAYGMYKQGKLKCPELAIYFEKMEELEKEVHKLEAEKRQQEQQHTGKNVCSCGCTLNPHQRFCSNCGKPVESDIISCTCGEQVKKGMQFCPSCGRKTAELHEAEKTERERTQANTKECVCGARIPEGQFMCMECGRKIEW